MKAAWAPTSGQWLGQTSGKTLGTAQLGSRDIFGGSSHRVVGPTRNRNSRTSQHSTSLFPGASILEDRRLLDSALLGSYNIALAALSNSSNREREELDRKSVV